MNSEGLGKLECFGCFKMDDNRSPGPIFKPVRMKIFSERFGPILGS